MQLFPDEVFQFCNSLLGYGRYECSRKVGGEFFGDGFFQFVIKQVRLGNGQYPFLIQQFGIVQLQLIEEYLILFANIIGIRRNQKEQ